MKKISVSQSEKYQSALCEEMDSCCQCQFGKHSGCSFLSIFNKDTKTRTETQKDKDYNKHITLICNKNKISVNLESIPRTVPRLLSILNKRQRQIQNQRYRKNSSVSSKQKPQQCYKSWLNFNFFLAKEEKYKEQKIHLTTLINQCEL